MEKVYHRPYFPQGLSDSDRQRPYICRLAPGKNSITFEWFDLSHSSTFTAYYRLRGSRKNSGVNVAEGMVTIGNLKEGRDYELYIETDTGARSNIRLFRTSAVPTGAVVVNYLHPDDKQYIFTGGRFLCSPHMIRLPSGRILASNDVFVSDNIPKLTLLYYSDDSGKSWHYLQDIYPFFWGAFFLYMGKLYFFGGTCQIDGDFQIICSEDDGKTWSLPTILIDGKECKTYKGGIGRGPIEPFLYDGRYYSSIELGDSAEATHGVRLLSFANGSDPMIKENWTLSDVMDCDSSNDLYNGYIPEFIEGNFITNPAGELEEIWRIMPKKYARTTIDTNNPKVAPKLVSIDEAPVSNSLFRIFKRNDVYYMVTNRESEKRFKYSILKGHNIWDKLDRFKRLIKHQRFNMNRNILSIFRSKDTKSWEFVTDIVNRENVCPKDEGYQYPAVISEEKHLFVLVRASFNKSDSQHNSNYTLFFDLNI